MKFKTTARRRFEVKINADIINALSSIADEYDINKNDLVETFLLYGVENFDKVVPSNKDKCPYCNSTVISLTQHCQSCGRRLYWSILRGEKQ